jgi:hypothetical protein
VAARVQAYRVHVRAELRVRGHLAHILDVADRDVGAVGVGAGGRAAHHDRHRVVGLDVVVGHLQQVHEVVGAGHAPADAAVGGAVAAVLAGAVLLVPDLVGLHAAAVARRHLAHEAAEVAEVLAARHAGAAGPVGRRHDAQQQAHALVVGVGHDVVQLAPEDLARGVVEVAPAHLLAHPGQPGVLGERQGAVAILPGRALAIEVGVHAVDELPRQGLVGAAELEGAVALVEAVAVLVAEQAQQHAVLRVRLVGVPLHALALEVLHPVGLAVLGVDLLELLADREAKGLQAAVAQPEVAEGRRAVAQRVPRLGEPGAVARVAHRLEGRLVLAALGQLAAHQAAEHVVAVALLPEVLGVLLQHGALEVLHAVELPGVGEALLNEGARDREAQGEEGVRGVLPRLQEAVHRRLSGLREVARLVGREGLGHRALGGALARPGHEGGDCRDEHQGCDDPSGHLTFSSGCATLLGGYAAREGAGRPPLPPILAAGADRPLMPL